MNKSEFLNKLKKSEPINESASVASVLGDPGSPTYGGFIGPLSKISKKRLYSRLFHTWKDGSVKNGSGVGKIAIPPQGYVKEHIYSVEGKMVTEGDLKDWFGADLDQKPSFNGGKLVAIEPKCLAFPYCSQGAIDKPLKLIGESKEHMCEDCYGYCSHIAEETGKKPEQIAKLIREAYLKNTLDEVLDESANNIRLVSFEEFEYNGRYLNFDALVMFSLEGDDIEYRIYRIQDVQVYNEESNEYEPIGEEESIPEHEIISTIKSNSNYDEYVKDEINDSLTEELNNDIVVNSLDESIELKFNKETITENIENKKTMENIKMTPEVASKCMNEMMANKELSECMYETLVAEGFLPNTLEEGDTYESQCRAMMEDAEICMEMVKACGMNESDCGMKVNEGIMDFLYGNPMQEFKAYLKKMGKDESMADAIANEDDPQVKQAMYMSAIDSDESNFAGKMGSRFKDIKHALGLIDIETRDANRSVGSMHKAINTEGVEMEEGAGINPAIFDQLKDCIEKGHSYEEAKQHVADAVDGWELSKEDYEEGKKKFGKANEGIELEEGGEGSRYMFFSNLEQIKNQAEQLLALDHGKIEAMLNSGHDWAADHVATAKETLDHAFDFITNDIMGEPETDMAPMPAMTAPAAGMETPDAAMAPVMEYDDAEDDDFDTEYERGDQYEREMKYFTKFMNSVEKATMTLAKALSTEEVKNQFNQYYGSFEASKNYTADDFITFLSRGAEEDYVQYADRLFGKGGLQSILATMVSPTKQDFLRKSGLMNDDSLMDAMDTILELQTKVIKKAQYLKDFKERRDSKQVRNNDNDDDFADEKEPTTADIKNIEKMGVPADDDEDFLEEVELPKFNPIKGKNVDSENKSTSDKENGEAIKDSEDTQETTEEKVDNLKNQKHINSDREAEIEEKQLGRNSMLDLDYGNDSAEDFKDRIEDEASGLAPEDHANVDHESEGGEKLMKAVKSRRPEREMDYGSKGLNIDKEFAYERSDALSESVNSELEKMKKLFTYDEKIINEEKEVKKINENEIFFNSVSKKKLL